MMKVSKAQVEDSRRAILEAAARLFRLRGFDDVSVGEIMKAAGLTHGAFYGYFASKDDLIASCFTRVLDQVHEQGQRPFDDYAADYLSASHRDDRGSGCLFSSLGTEAVRASAETRRVMTASIKQQIANLSVTAPGSSAAERRRAAIAGWSAMVGAVMLSRISDDPLLARDLLVETQASLRTPRKATGARQE